ncbi:carbohydrate esterase family 9 protein [Daldinia caldariorum]|uniref:carbohydrate esterase family 9 protein n=1 Tax=Daldinia caldariorum TaxID=326644 RepID=UPI002008AA3D|nr:carbohydrate esterase family 9 protein [Daldinia caldariorum]KAI1472247.1 carbohydrate esterase family 9 protein [Daldinia caldariorum]
MPHSLPSSPKSTPRDGRNGITKFTNCRILKGDKLLEEDLWVNSVTRKIIRSQAAFYDDFILPDEVIDLGGRILSPGIIECQLNGAFGFNFSTLLEPAVYAKKVKELNKQMVKTGVTSYVPTITSQRSELYQRVLPYLGPSGYRQIAEDGAESLGAHCEGPFLSPTKNGVHNVDVIREAETFADLEDCYGAENLDPEDLYRPTPIKMITAAPERGQMTKLIPELTKRGIIYSIGHSEATYEQASAAVAAGATMITHLFNAMRPLHHRNPGIFGVLGLAESLPRPYFGIIADGEHLHPTTIKIAFNAHPDGFILVTDSMHLVGLPDGAYQWTNGERASHIVKKGNKLILEGTDRIAGSSITLIECVSNFLSWSGATIPQALKAVTSTPAAMLGLQGIKGCLDDGADADLVVLSEKRSENRTDLIVDEVWKFGTKVFSRS